MSFQKIILFLLVLTFCSTSFLFAYDPLEEIKILRTKLHEIEEDLIQLKILYLKSNLEGPAKNHDDVLKPYITCVYKYLVELEVLLKYDIESSDNTENDSESFIKRLPENQLWFPLDSHRQNKEFLIRPGMILFYNKIIALDNKMRELVLQVRSIDSK